MVFVVSVVLLVLVRSVVLVESVEGVESGCLCLRSTSAGAAEVKVARKARKRRMATAMVDTERDIVTDWESGQIGVGSWGYTQLEAKLLYCDGGTSPNLLSIVFFLQMKSRQSRQVHWG